MEIKILGIGCPQCKRLEQVAREAAAEVGVEATFIKVTDIAEIMTYDIVATPGLVINGQVTSAGRVPSEAEVVEWIKKAQARAKSVKKEDGIDVAQGAEAEN
jgi:small redox-active disulfide protein 2